VGLAATHDPDVGGDDDDFEPEALEDPDVRVVLGLVADVEPGLVTVATVGSRSVLTIPSSRHLVSLFRLIRTDTARTGNRAVSVPARAGAAPARSRRSRSMPDFVFAYRNPAGYTPTPETRAAWTAWFDGMGEQLAELASRPWPGPRSATAVRTAPSWAAIR